MIPIHQDFSPDRIAVLFISQAMPEGERVSQRSKLTERDTATGIVRHFAARFSTFLKKELHEKTDATLMPVWLAS